MSPLSFVCSASRTLGHAEFKIFAHLVDLGEKSQEAETRVSTRELAKLAGFSVSSAHAALQALRRGQLIDTRAVRGRSGGTFVSVRCAEHLTSRTFSPPANVLAAEHLKDPRNAPETPPKSPRNALDTAPSTVFIPPVHVNVWPAEQIALPNVRPAEQIPENVRSAEHLSEGDRTFKVHESTALSSAAANGTPVASRAHVESINPDKIKTSIELTPEQMQVLDKVFAAKPADCNPQDIRTVQAWVRDYPGGPGLVDEEIAAQLLSITEMPLLASALRLLSSEGHRGQKAPWFVTTLIHRIHRIGWRQQKAYRAGRKPVKREDGSSFAQGLLASVMASKYGNR